MADYNYLLSNRLYDRKDNTPYCIKNAYIEEESELSNQRRCDFLNSLARADLEYNFYFIPITKQRNNEPYSLASASIYVSDFWINNQRVFYYPHNKGIALSLKPGTYNFKVEYVIDNAFEIKSNKLGVGYTIDHSYSSKLNEKKTLELKDVYINETTEYILCLSIKAIPYFDKYSKGSKYFYEFDKWDKEVKFQLVNKESLFNCVSDGFRASIYPHHYPVNRDYSSYDFKNERYNMNTATTYNPIFNKPFTIQKEMFKSGNYYYGPMVNGFKDSLGMKYEDGNYYWGKFKWSTGYTVGSEGYGVQYFKNGDHLFGFHSHFIKPQGECLYFYKNGDMELRFYDNEGKANGKGAYFSGIHFNEALFKDDKRVGINTYSEDRDLSLEYEYITHVRKIDLIRIVTEKYVYCGEVKNGKRHGIGACFFNNGNRYCGYFNNDKFYGAGTYYFKNGNILHGYWKNDMANGQCRVYFPDGTFEDRYYEDNKYVKKYWFDSNTINRPLSESKTAVASTSDATKKVTPTVTKQTTSPIKPTVSKTTQTVNKSTVATSTTKPATVSKPTTSTSTTKSSTSNNADIKLSDGSRYVGKVDYNGKPHGFGSLYFTNGDTYYGDFVHGIREGTGSLYSKDDTVYQGEFKNNQKNGHGTCKWSNGDSYVGNYVNDCREGYGEYTFANGSKYIGEYKQSKRHGKGKFYNAYGRLEQEGNWINGVFEEKKATLSKPNYSFENHVITDYDSKIIYSDGKYIGRTISGVPEPFGTYYYNNKNIYSGGLSGGLKDGYGVEIDANGTIFMGEFANGRRNGFGILFKVDGSTYFGMWKNSLMNGVMFIHKNRECSVNVFKDDRLVDILAREYGIELNIKNKIPQVPVNFRFFGGPYLGDLVSLVREGYGKSELNDGTTYVGMHSNNLCHGIGCQYLRRGNIYIGQFENSKFEGLGALIDRSGNVTVSKYSKGLEVRKIF